MGSHSDTAVMDECRKVLEHFGVECDVKVLSAHRTMEELLAFCDTAEQTYDVIIAGAGYAAHLAGVVASRVTLPVIGVPLDSSPLKGIDALLSTVQMPAGVTVATVTIGRAGARNAGVLAVEIMALKYPELKEKLKAYREELKKKVLKGQP